MTELEEMVLVHILRKYMYTQHEINFILANIENRDLIWETYKVSTKALMVKVQGACYNIFSEYM